MKSYLTLPEIFKALSEGKKIRDTVWPSDNYWWIKDNVIVTESDISVFDPYFYSSNWEIFEESKKPTKLYAYFYHENGTTSWLIKFNEDDKLSCYIRAPQFDTEVVLAN